jgi:hypothetical protein
MICPKCKKEFTGYPALSRIDNKTEICSECGIKEALESFGKEIIDLYIKGKKLDIKFSKETIQKIKKDYKNFKFVKFKDIFGKYCSLDQYKGNIKVGKLFYSYNIDWTGNEENKKTWSDPYNIRIIKSENK